MGETPHRLAKEASLLRRCGLSPARPGASRRGACRQPPRRQAQRTPAPPAAPAARRVRRRPPPRELGSVGASIAARILSPLLRPRASHRGENVLPQLRVLSSGGRQAPAECLGSGNEHGLGEVGRLDTRLHRRAPSAPERPDHPHPAVAALGDARSLACQDRAGCGLRVFGVGLAAGRQVPSVGPLDLNHRDPRGLQVAAQLKAP
jgi:hypothetical protein